MSERKGPEFINGEKVIADYELDVEVQDEDKTGEDMVCYLKGSYLTYLTEFSVLFYPVGEIPDGSSRRDPLGSIKLMTIYGHEIQQDERGYYILFHGINGRGKNIRARLSSLNTHCVTDLYIRLIVEWARVDKSEMGHPEIKPKPFPHNLKLSVAQINYLEENMELMTRQLARNETSLVPGQVKDVGQKWPMSDFEDLFSLGMR